MKIRFQINGKPVEADVPPMKRLLDVLREDLRLTGTKEGCGEGECGACSILMNGRLVNACLVPAAQAAGRTLQTIEGITEGEGLHPVQSAFLECGGTQCGICTPGMILASQSLLNEHPDPARITDAEIRAGLAGNLCRCTGYVKIIDAVRKAIEAVAAK
jgi:carbon-monoxide dehydrogenase small subunit